jgi:glucan-binding YG repeat protein
MQTGWIAHEDGTWSYLDPTSGHMKFGWILYNGSWYYIGANGRMVTGWFYDNGKMYYFDATGRMTQGA